MHHSDYGGHYLSVRYTERLQAARIEASMGSRGDAYHNTLAVSVIGLIKTEPIRHAGPWRGIDEVEYARLEWIYWFNHHRLLEPLGYLSPAGTRRNALSLRSHRSPLEHPNHRVPGKPWAVQDGSGVPVSMQSRGSPANCRNCERSELSYRIRLLTAPNPLI
jgi:hypothetical protein